MVSSKDLSIRGAKLISLVRHNDNRGWINENWRDQWNEDLDIPCKFVQDMLSWNNQAYTLRGLHALRQPIDQYKLVSVINGRVFDVIVDARNNSETYGKYISIELSVSDPYMLLVPPGCYHGYLTLEENTAVAYKVSQYHKPEYDSGILWNDPDIGIEWPLQQNSLIISDRDKSHPQLKNL